MSDLHKDETPEERKARILYASRANAQRRANRFGHVVWLALDFTETSHTISYMRSAAEIMAQPARGAARTVERFAPDSKKIPFGAWQRIDEQVFDPEDTMGMEGWSDNTITDWTEQYPTDIVCVRKFHRTVRAGGTSIACIALIARRKPLQADFAEDA